MGVIGTDYLARIAGFALNAAVLAVAVLVAARAWRGGLHPSRRMLAGVSCASLADLLVWEILLPTPLARVPGASYVECAVAGPGLLLALALWAVRLRGTPFARPFLLTAGAGGAWWATTSALPLLAPAASFGLSTDRAAPPAGQSTWWSCGSAAVARVAWEVGCPLSEREAALLADTRPGRGTTSIGMATALGRLGMPARVVPAARWEQIRDAPKPCLAETRVLGRVLHVVTILEASDRTVRLYDPMIGDTELSREEFLGTWTRVLVAPVQPTTRQTSAVQSSL